MPDTGLEPITRQVTSSATIWKKGRLSPCSHEAKAVRTSSPLLCVLMVRP